MKLASLLVEYERPAWAYRSLAKSSCNSLGQMNPGCGSGSDSVVPEFQSCHLATVDRYFAVGHIPVDVIKRMLAEKPAIAGITLPGMPGGAPGMGGRKTEPFKIYALGDGAPKVYATV